MSTTDDSVARSMGIGDRGPRAEGTVVKLPVAPIQRVVWVIVGVLIAATFVAQFAHDAFGQSTIINLFDSDQKLNFPSGMKIILLLASTALLAILGLAVSDRWHRVRWFGMSAVFALLTLDEMTYMHQHLSDGLHDSFGTSGVFRFAWVLIYLPLVLVLVVCYWPFWRKLANPFRTQLLIAAIAFAGGSGGIELVKSKLFDDRHWKLSFGLVASVSDSLELVGLALLATALLTTLARVTNRVTFTLER